MNRKYATQLYLRCCTICFLVKSPCSYYKLTWSPSTAKQTCLIERIHSKFINKLPLTHRSKFPFTLTERRRFHTAVQIYKSLHQLSPPYLHNIFQFSKDITGHISRNVNRLFVPRVLTNYGKRSFFYRGAVLWNSLSLSVTGATTLSSFKNSYFNF